MAEPGYVTAFTRRTSGSGGFSPVAPPGEPWVFDHFEVRDGQQVAVDQYGRETGMIRGGDATYTPEPSEVGHYFDIVPNPYPPTTQQTEPDAVPVLPVGFSGTSWLDPFREAAVGPDIGGLWGERVGELSRLMGDWNTLTGHGTTSPGGGGYGGGVSAQEQAERALRVQQILEELELNKTGVGRDYDPYLHKTAAQIALERERMGEDMGIFTSLLGRLPASFRASGRLTDDFYEKAVRAVGLQDSDARGRIDASFAGARGRVQAMVLSVSKDSPEMAATLGQGLDEIRAYIQNGMATDTAGWNAVLAAGHQLAQATLASASAGVVGENARSQARLLTQYQNSIDDMLLEERRMQESRDNALAQLEDEAQLKIDQLMEQWAMSDAARGGGGGVGGAGARGQMSPELYALLQDAYSKPVIMQDVLSRYVDDWDQTAGLSAADKEALVETGMLAAQYGYDDFTAMLDAATAGEAHMSEDDLEYARGLAQYFKDEGRVELLLNAQAMMEQGHLVADQYDREIRNPTTSWGLGAATLAFAGENYLSGEELLNQILGSGLYGGRMDLFNMRYGTPEYTAQLAQQTSPDALIAALGQSGFSSPLGPSGSATSTAPVYHSTGR